MKDLIIINLLKHCESLYRGIKDNTYEDTSVTPSETMHIDDGQYTQEEVAKLAADIAEAKKYCELIPIEDKK